MPIVPKSHLQFSYVLKDGLLGKYLVISNLLLP